MIEENHPEATCQDCNGPNIVWFAANGLWNRVMGGPDGVVCPGCFVRRAEGMGVNRHAWELRQEEFWTSVKDREPPIGEVVFVVMFTAPPAYHVMARGGGNWKHVTHWAPIPTVSSEERTVNVRVKRVDQSPLNPLRWSLELECGHDVWVTSKTKPSRKTQYCATCVEMKALRRHP